MAQSSITAPVVLPFSEYKWLWATWTVREIYKNPAIWLKVLRVMYKYEGLEYGVNTSSGQLFHQALNSLGLTDDNNSPISFLQSDRSFLRGYQTYWTNTGVLIPPDKNDNKIGLTPLGKAIATGKMLFKDYVEHMVKKFQLPNPITQYRLLQQWNDNNSNVKPLAFILEVLLELYNRAGFGNAYVTEREAAILIYPLSATMNPGEVCEELLAWRESDPSFNISFMYINAAMESNEFRSIKEFLQFLSAGEFLVATEMAVTDFNINGGVLASTNSVRTCYFLNIIGTGKWNQVATSKQIYDSITLLIEEANNSGYFIADLTKPEIEIKTEYLDYLSVGVNFNATIRTVNFDAQIDQYVELLKDNKQIILSGPPGTGKTRLALQIAEKLEVNNELAQKEMILFHQSSSYEDFIEGIRPNVESTTLSYTYKHGMFKLLCKKAEMSPDKFFVLIIDEINRGNISNIFGELIFLLEPSYRHAEYAVELQYTGESLWVPSNLLIIGTMNSTDKSAIDIDLALRRRFSIINLYPDVAVINSKLNELGVEVSSSDGRIIDIAKTLEGLNSIICSNVGLGDDFQIGQAFLLPQEGKEYNGDFLLKAWNYKILPLLNEYIQLSPSLKGDLSDMGFVIRNGRIQLFSDEDMFNSLHQLSGIV
ncbi:hypothetical protein J2Z32_002956 [Paenibacillus turicensis]|uniref:AAA+ ATPase domain-containing protein n=1 Tax=Paenibacillus turicensis TaxID=160487 RepID=A0ABS4FUQ2_9BACL|nr:AAA family ATPase [Paenibacillus turicensis]MBP1906307.1 hypothetical protein [Paenibacillus turicensis]